MPSRMLIVCKNVDCDFTGDRALPILATDDEIYRRLPAFIVATIDKFAALPWVGQTGAFFGHVDRADNQGFYGAAEPRSGARLGNGWQLDPPDLIVQDELHLISGPLGTVAGLYETAIDYLATRTKGDIRIRPKIVASTATVRRAQTQIRALFDRNETAIFPPPGVSRRNSFFAETLRASDENPARKYIGLAALGRGPKLVFLRALVALQAAARDNIKKYHPNKYSSNTLRSMAQNIASSWKQAGFIEGKTKNIRIQQKITYQIAAFAVFMAYLKNERGNFILQNIGVKALCMNETALRSLAMDAALRDILQFQYGGGVTTFAFLNLLQKTGIDAIKN